MTEHRVWPDAGHAPVVPPVEMALLFWVDELARVERSLPAWTSRRLPALANAAPQPLGLIPQPRSTNHSLRSRENPDRFGGRDGT